jgi:hypothetical protein
MKMSKNKKRLNKWVTLTCAHKQKDNRQFSLGEMMIKEQRRVARCKNS